MTLASGTRLGPYEIASPLGAGGMGEVYRARDTRLGREVAVKVLPAGLVGSEEALRRFQSEARLISQLSHPNVCAIYDVGRESDVAYLVMELLEGETLASRLEKGPLPLDQLVRYGMQICSALDAAHARGIVHRDLKPGNVMLAPSGVKLLDFGLAKALDREVPEHPRTQLPTHAMDPKTGPGVVLGTLQYMSPEQLEGRPADRRTDIFALGSVVYEMATGRRAFTGTSHASLISAILAVEPPPVSSLAPASPPALDRLVRSCLAKDPAERRQSAHDVGLELREMLAGSGAAAVSAPLTARRRTLGGLPWLTAGVAIGAIALWAWGSTRSGTLSRTAPGVIRFEVAPPEKGAFRNTVEVSSLAFSPDGSRLAYVASLAGGPPGVFVRALSSLQAEPLPGTEGAESIFFSPDGRTLAFFAGDRLKRVDLAGGAPVAICEVIPGGGKWGTWGEGGDILFSLIAGEAIYRVPSAGGTPKLEVRAARERDETRVAHPWFLPGGRRFLFVVRRPDGSGELRLAEPGRDPRGLMPVASAVQYADPGLLVFAREGALVAQRFDPRTGDLRGGPFSVADRVNYFLSTGAAAFAVSRSGSLAYQSAIDVRRLTWFDRSGRSLGTVGPPGGYLDVSLSRDGRRLLLDRTREGIGTYDIWGIELERNAETRITSGINSEFAPTWLPGGTSILYSTVQESFPQLIRRDLATGTDEAILPASGFQVATDVSPDGRRLAYHERGLSGVWTLHVLDLAGGGKPTPFLPSRDHRQFGRFSPDGRYLAHLSNQSGPSDVYVAPYPGPGEVVRVTTGGARCLRWSAARGEIIYVSGDQRLISVPVRTSPTLSIGAPVELFRLPGGAWLDFDLTPDGQRILAVEEMVSANRLPLSVVVGWSTGVGEP